MKLLSFLLASLAGLCQQEPGAAEQPGQLHQPHAVVPAQQVRQRGAEPRRAAAVGPGVPGRGGRAAGRVHPAARARQDQGRPQDGHVHLAHGQPVHAGLKAGQSMHGPQQAAFNSHARSDALRHRGAQPAYGFVAVYRFFQWELFKSDRARCDTVLFLSVNLISALAVLLEPYMPSLSVKINAQLNQQMLEMGALDTANDAQAAVLPINIKPGHILGTPSPLFRRIEDEEVASLRVRFGGAPAEKKKGDPFPLQLILGTITEAKVRSTRKHSALHLFSLEFCVPSP
jgi:hypothetical protein